jgi:hypothetical protein
MTRSQPSVPARKLVEEYLKPGDMVFDWGCGRGKDLEYFLEQGFACGGYDIKHRPFPNPFCTSTSYDWVLCAYVLNVIPPSYRNVLLADIHKFLPKDGRAMFAVRAAKDINREIKDSWTALYDGWRTSSGTFQRGFTTHELEDLLHFHGFRTFKRISHDPVIVVTYKY